MNKMNKGTLIVLILLFVNVFLIYFLFSYVKNEGAQCSLAPLNYGYIKLQEANKDELQCSCVLLGDKPSPTFYFNENSTWIGNKFQADLSTSSLPFNFSLIFS